MSQKEKDELFFEGFGMAMAMVAHRQGHTTVSWTMAQIEAVVHQHYTVKVVENHKGEKIWKLHLESKEPEHPKLDL